jgi:C4-dicarboxylate-specific signal transduction histidine kinase
MNSLRSETSEHLRFSSAVLRLLGEELNPNANQGLVELVKNAYDADATWCRIEFEKEHLPGGTIRIRDNGEGMELDAIRSGWLTVGESRKRPTGRSLRKKRLMVGSKGLGRLAALRLGRTAVLVSRPYANPEVEYRLMLDWERFDQNTAVDDISISVETWTRELGAEHGCEIEIRGLYSPWTEVALQRLARVLLLLSDPFANRSAAKPKVDFAITLQSKEFDEIGSAAAIDYWSYADYYLDSGINDKGKAWAKVSDASGNVLFEGEHADIASKGRTHYLVPTLRFELWEFKLGNKKFATTTMNKATLGKWVSEFGGVHFYYRDVRVAPYGDPGNDWLDLNLGRASSPEERPSTNNSIGRVRVEDPEALLIQKTDRQGFLENTTFEELRCFGEDVVDWMQKVRVKKRDEHKRALKAESVANEQASRIVLDAEIQKLPVQERKPVQDAVVNHLKAVSESVSILQAENELYHTLGTIGVTAAAFAHQSEKPLNLIQDDSHTLETLLGNPNEPSFPELSLASLRNIRIAAQALLAFSTVTLRLLEHEKRRRGRLDLHEIITEICELLQPYLESRSAVIRYDLVANEPIVWGSRAAIESIFTNLIVNSLRAFARDYGEHEGDEDATGDRVIVIGSQTLGERVRITFADSGPGIRDISVEDIWIVGRTTTPRGSGLGLCIVRDTVEDMGGAITALPVGVLGGAEFIIDLPMRK